MVSAKTSLIDSRHNSEVDISDILCDSLLMFFWSNIHDKKQLSLFGTHAQGKPKWNKSRNENYHMCDSLYGLNDKHVFRIVSFVCGHIFMLEI